MAILPDKRIQELAHKWLKGSLTEAEQKEFDAWFHTQSDEPVAVPPSFGGTPEEQRERIFAQIEGRIHRPAKVTRLWPRIAAAASILIAISVGGYFVLHQHQNVNQVAQLKPGTFKNDALPGNKAYLTMANGQQITVSSLPAGKINAIPNANVQKTANGAIVYGNVPDADASLVYNTLTVPRGGGKHEIKLADGTLAILDAESSIRFPVAFNGKDRRVSITGQVYFEVVHNAAHPFYVTAGNQTIEDIGTHFNVNTFDGSVKTTLIEGSVKVNNVLLQPGQQAVENNGKLTLNDHVDEEEVIAWKNDMFKFGSNTSLQTIMNQISRWYDMDVVYQGKTKIYHFGGDMPRYSKLSDVLKILAYNGVQFSVDGKKIIVYQ
jgi:ferric-dicitrate binding protein FerR (iron transport regulator)